MNDKDKLIIQQRLKERRLFLNMTYQELADKTGLSKSTLQRYETGGISNLPIDNVYKISDALGVNPSYFTDVNYNDNSESVNNSNSNDVKCLSFNKLQREIYLKEQERRKDALFQIVAPFLLKNNYKIEEIDRGYLGDLVAKKSDEIWYFEILWNSMRNQNDKVSMGAVKSQLYQNFGRLVMWNKPISKYSIVVTDKEVFELICKTTPNYISIKTSVFYLDIENYEFAEHIF